MLSTCSIYVNGWWISLACFVICGCFCVLKLTPNFPSASAPKLVYVASSLHNTCWIVGWLSIRWLMVAWRCAVTRAVCHPPYSLFFHDVVSMSCLFKSYIHLVCLIEYLLWLWLMVDGLSAASYCVWDVSLVGSLFAVSCCALVVSTALCFDFSYIRSYLVFWSSWFISLSISGL
jgi:hypothetical protein